ncbi:MAG: hypothetical protein AB7G38_15580 [Dehalococcoidia bacterium]
MLLKPPVSQEAALEWLKARTVEAYGVEITPAIEKDLMRLAESMAKVSAVDLPVEIEPLLL